MNRLSANSSHPLIPRDPTYSVNRKLVTFHSVDRNVVQWPHANEFEIQLPEALTSVESMRLAEIALPSSYYNVSRELQNTTFQLTVPSASPSTFVVTLEDGFYSSRPDRERHNTQGPADRSDIRSALQRGQPETLVLLCGRIQHRRRRRRGRARVRGAGRPRSLLPPGLRLHPGRRSVRALQRLGSSVQPRASAQNTRRHAERRRRHPSGLRRHADSGRQPNYYYVEATFPTSLSSQDVIYMEVDKYNSMDELRPYPSAPTTCWTATTTAASTRRSRRYPSLDSRADRPSSPRTALCKTPPTTSNPPLERVQKLRFRFRYHDGRLVDFKQENFNFSIAFNELRNEPLRT